MTAPPLVVTSVEATPTPAGTLLRLDGEFPQADLVQQPLEIQVLVYEKDGERFLRYELPRGGFSGAEPALADGLDASEVEALLAASVAEPRLRLLLLAPGRIELLLPAGFAPGEAEAQLFLVYRGEPLLSNSISVAIPGSQP